MISLAFLEKLMKKDDDLDIQDFLNNLDVEKEAIAEDADALVKSLTLTDEADCQLVLKETKDGNLVLLNIEGLVKRNAVKLKELVNILRSGVHSIDGDIARISLDKVLVTPSKVKIVKRRAA